MFSRFDRLFDEWVRMMPFRPMALPRWLEAVLIRVEVDGSNQVVI